MSRFMALLCTLFFVVVLAGCSKKEEQAKSPAPEQQPPAQAEQAQPASPAQAEAPSTSAESTPARPTERRKAKSAAPAQNPPAARRAGADESGGVPAAQGVAPATRSAQTQPAPPPQPLTLVIPAGTQLSIRLSEPLDSGTNKTGDTFQATLDNDLTVDGTVVAPRGSLVAGRLVDVKQSGRVQGRAAMSLALKELHVGDNVYPIQTNVLAFEAESTKNKDAAKVGIGAGIGAIIGAVAGGGKGAAIGAAVGGGAGGATVLATRGKELNFPAEHQFKFSLKSDTRVTLR